MSLLRNSTGSLRPAWSVAGFLALSLASALLAAAAVGMLGITWGQPAFPWPVPLLAVLLVFGVTSFFLRLEGRRPADLGLRLDAVRLRQFAVGLVVGTAVYAGLAAALGLTGVLSWSTRHVGAALLVTGTAYLFFALLLEELVFRGYALRRLADAMGNAAAIGLLAVLFGGYHLLGLAGSGEPAGLAWLWTAAAPALGAVVFGVAALRTGSIALPVGIHLAGNWVQWQLFTLPGDPTPMGLWRPVVAGEHSGSSTLFQLGYMATMAVALAGVLLVTRRRAADPSAAERVRRSAA